MDRPHFSVIHEKLEDLANSKVVSSLAHSVYNIVMLFCELPLSCKVYYIYYMHVHL